MGAVRARRLAALERRRTAVVGEVPAHGRVRLSRNQFERRGSGFPSIRNQFAAARERVKLISDLFEPPVGHRQLIWRWTEPLASWLELIWRWELPLVGGWGKWSGRRWSASGGGGAG